MSSGDVGYFDEHDLLYVSGRDDEMIVSGGENVFPAEVEDLISGHPEVVEATALGVEDKEWGHRLRAFVVKTDGASIDEDAIKTYVQETIWPATRCRARSSSSTSCRATRRERSSSANYAKWKWSNAFRLVAEAGPAGRDSAMQCNCPRGRRWLHVEMNFYCSRSLQPCHMAL